MKDMIIELVKWIFTGITNASYPICVFVAMVSIIFYVAGCKKAGRYVSYSIITYIILQTIKGLLG